MTKVTKTLPSLLTRFVRAVVACSASLGIAGLASSGFLYLTSVVASEAHADTFCRIDPQQIVRKANLLQAAQLGDRQAAEDYEKIVTAHANQLRQCRQQSWLHTQAVWMRVYPCDLQARQLDQVLDNAVNFGYNRIYLNVFYDGRILLPFGDNPTVWPSVVGSQASNADLLAKVIAGAHRRGITVYAWLFAMNFGPSYAARFDRQSAIARNGFGESNLQDPRSIPEEARVSHVFVDPYNTQAREDLRTLVRAVAQRRPDGIVFDYIRYPQRSGSVVNNVRDLMIYGDTSLQKLFELALSGQGQEAMIAYLKNGSVGNLKIPANIPLWKLPPQMQPVTSGGDLDRQLWQLVLAHARKGVVEFLDYVSQPAHEAGISTGAVFFPKAHLTYGNGVDPRLQPWFAFTNVSEWAPMSYAACGNASCIIDEITLVMEKATGSQAICPILMGYWGQSSPDRLALEQQIAAVHQAYPQLNCLSHFAYSWLDLNADRQRRTCQL
ncbi:family 10 glycosylhydrolase [Tumidithrix elongata RA019]|uniref:Family 10 glycosylhydrolase n=1 Tax=Tumidithrix elongata BACA0141 TaxID=2716417 RepID=A0AAW9PZQ5_9CYAN|nr:family 10 glycosylhydrolase [Tumidithrix elongata RA019]